MALIVEDGTGKEDSNTYNTEAELETFAADFKNSDITTAYTTGQKEAALLDATQYIARFKLVGVRIARAQALEMPRANGIDRNSFSLPSDEVWREVKAAHLELAYSSLVDGILSPNVSAGDSSLVRSMDKLAVMETEREYKNGSSSSPIYRRARDLLYPVLDTRSGVKVVR